MAEVCCGLLIWWIDWSEVHGMSDCSNDMSAHSIAVVYCPAWSCSAVCSSEEAARCQVVDCQNQVKPHAPTSKAKTTVAKIAALPTVRGTSKQATVLPWRIQICTLCSRDLRAICRQLDCHIHDKDKSTYRECIAQLRPSEDVQCGS